MFYHDGKLQYKVRVERTNPQFAKLLQQAIERNRRRDQSLSAIFIPGVEPLASIKMVNQ